MNTHEYAFTPLHHESELRPDTYFTLERGGTRVVIDEQGGAIRELTINKIPVLVTDESTSSEEARNTTPETASINPVADYQLTGTGPEAYTWGIQQDRRAGRNTSFHAWPFNTPHTTPKHDGLRYTDYQIEHPTTTTARLVGTDPITGLTHIQEIEVLEDGITIHTAIANLGDEPKRGSYSWNAHFRSNRYTITDVALRDLKGTYDNLAISLHEGTEITGNITDHLYSLSGGNAVHVCSIPSGVARIDLHTPDISLDLVMEAQGVGAEKLIPSLALQRPPNSDTICIMPALGINRWRTSTLRTDRLTIKPNQFITLTVSLRKAQSQGTSAA